MRLTTPFAFSRPIVRAVTIFLLLVFLLILVAVVSSERYGPIPQRQTSQDPNQQSYRLHIAGFDFDPLREEPKIPGDLKMQLPQTDAYYIIQFHKPPTREERAIVQKRYGLRLTDYIPNLAYLERLTPPQVARLSQEPIVRWVGLYQPAFKLDPTIGKRKFVSRERRAEPGILLMVVAFQGTQVSELAATIRGFGFEILNITNEPKYGVVRMKVRVMTPQDVNKIAMLQSVRLIEEVGDVTLNNGTTSWVIQTNVNNSRTIWGHGLLGEGQIVGHIDGFIDLNHCFFQNTLGQPNTAGPSHRKVVAFRNATANSPSGEQAHGTFSAGNAAGEDLNNGALSAAPNPNNGNAPRARLSYGSLRDLDWIPNGVASFYNYLSEAHADGAFIHTNSWDDKSTSNYTGLSAELDRFTWDREDDLVIIGPDNNGTIRPPDTAKNALVVNATMQNPSQNSFSSGIRMFSLDGRLKPDLMAPGASIVSASRGTACGTRTDSGTSFAAPATAGAAALTRQYYTEGWYPTGTREASNAFTPTGALLKATLMNATVDVTGLAGYPGTAATGEGWGRLLLENGLFFAGDAMNLRVWDTHHAEGLYAGAPARTHTVNVATNTQPLKVTLVWTEPPAAANTANPVVNNLDLTVTSPDGTQVFRGNVFDNTGFSATGGVADTLNNVEMVVVNSPAPGAWIVTVNAAAINVGNPGQGYALVTTADMTEPPAPSGNQDTLVVRVKYSDIATTPSLPNLRNLIDNDVVNYFNEVTYNKATVLPDYLGPIGLAHEKAYYTNPSRSLLIEMTEEVVARLVSDNSNVFTKGTPDPNDDVDRLILVTNDEDFSQDWATTGPWPYDLPGGFTRPLSVSIQSYVDPVARFAHGLGHQFSLVDLYNHPGVTFSRPAYADEWDNMAKPFRSIHYLVWEKERAGWINTPTNQITYIPRPAASGSYTGPNPIPLFFQESIGSSATNTKAIALGLTNAVPTFAGEDVFYFIEAREKATGSLDNNLPSSGVLIYFVNERIPQGQGPVILLDKTPGTPSLDDAAFQVGDSPTIPGTGITITVLDGSGGSAFNIQVAYAPINTDHNVRITAGDTLNGTFYSYFSSDLWVDSPKNTLGNLAGGPPPNDQIENPVIGMENKLCARISNDGPNTAFDFDVRFRISEPYHTVGGEADFDQLVAIRRIPGLVPAGLPVPAGMVASPTIVCVPWTPVDDGDTHSCLLVDFINLVGTDTNMFDNSAQENLEEVTSVTASPFHPVTYPFELTNPYTEPALFYFRVEGAPQGWSVVLNPKKILLNPGQRVAGTATIKPPPDAQVCTSEVLQITSWSPRGDTIINVGGAVVQVDLRKNTLLTLDTRVEECRKNDQTIKHHASGRFTMPQSQSRFCEKVVARGCTNPVLANQTIIVKYVMPDGTPVYHEVMTDAMGCYEDFVVSTSGGDWQVTAEYEGDKCQGPVTAGPRKWNCCKPIR